MYGTDDDTVTRNYTIPCCDGTAGPVTIIIVDATNLYPSSNRTYHESSFDVDAFLEALERCIAKEEHRSLSREWPWIKQRPLAALPKVKRPLTQKASGRVPRSHKTLSRHAIARARRMKEKLQ